MNFTLEQLTFAKQLHPEVLSVLNKLKQKYGVRLIFLSPDTEWINFEVRGLTDEVLIRELDREQANLFGDMSHFQVVRGLDRVERGIFLRHLYSLSLRKPEDTGFWYY